MHGRALVVAAIPSHGCRAVIHSAVPYLSRDAVIVSATKGLEGDTLLRMSEVIAQEAGSRASGRRALGPELRGGGAAQQLPTVVLAASGDAVATQLVQQEFRAPYFRLYGSDDVVESRLARR